MTSLETQTKANKFKMKLKGDYSYRLAGVIYNKDVCSCQLIFKFI